LGLNYNNLFNSIIKKWKYKTINLI
jgi:hypothetical protein